jgi:hypothetical protein
MNEETKLYVVAVKIYLYTEAPDKHTALDNVNKDLHRLCMGNGDGGFTGYVPPELTDLVEDTEA